MFNPVLIAAILHPIVIPEDCCRGSISSSYFDVLSIDSTVAISFLFLQELRYLDEKKGKDKKDEVHDEGSKKDN
jgi:hypothetical protein